MILQVKDEFSRHALSNLNVGSIKELIDGQAKLHTTSFNGDVERLKIHFLQEQQRSSKNDSMQLLNGMVATHDFQPVAYLMYYPAFDQYGRFGLYGEDIYVDDNYRKHGIGHKLLCAWAREAVNAQGCFLEWVTDLRNEPFRQYIREKMHGKKAEKINFDASILIDKMPFVNGVDSKYVTRLITKDDGDYLTKVGVNRQLADHSSDFPVVGFVTYNKETNNVAAVTVANLRYSTFQTRWGLVLEPVAFAGHIGNTLQKSEVLKSICHGVHNFCEFSKDDLNIKNVNWYTSRKDKGMIQVLAYEFRLKYDQISDDRRSKMVPHFLDKDALKVLANSQHEIPAKYLPRTERSFERRLGAAVGF